MGYNVFLIQPGIRIEGNLKEKYTVKKFSRFYGKFSKMRGNMTVFYRFCKKQPNTVFLKSILHAIVDWNDSKLGLVAWD